MCFQAGELGLEFAQRGDNVVIIKIKVGKAADRCPFPKIKVGMHLVRVQGGAIVPLPNNIGIKHRSSDLCQVT